MNIQEKALALLLLVTQTLNNTDDVCQLCLLIPLYVFVVFPLVFKFFVDVF